MNKFLAIDEFEGSLLIDEEGDLGDLKWLLMVQQEVESMANWEGTNSVVEIVQAI
jgi:hypothetical protein